MSFSCRQTFICIAFFFIHLPKSEANDEAIQLGLRKVNLGTNLDGWTTVTQTKQIRYGEWKTSNGFGSVGAGGGWGNWGGSSLVW